MGWHTFQSTVFEKLYTTAQKQNQQLEIVLTMMDADDISAFLLSKDAQKNFYDTMKQLVLAEPISGINIDIEYAGTVTPQLKNAYTAFIQTLADEVRSKNPDIKIRIDVFGEAALKERIWDIPKLGAIVDSIIVMAYDYHRTSSPIAGPVAPIFGSEQKLWSSDIALCLKAFLETVPPEKIILGIPLYGYEWQTTSHERGATTYPKTGALATYKRVAEIIRSPPENTLVYKRWDPQALSPYLTLEETIGKKKEIRTIYYEDARSLRYKLQLAQQAKLGGVAFWAIGYEGNNPDIWQIFK
jgi:spore germination protein YaaH